MILATTKSPPKNLNNDEHSFDSKNSTKSSLISSFSTPTWYHNLPIEVLVRIFKYFDETELRRNIIPVCRQWKHASLRPELWKKLEIYGKNTPTHFICHRIRNFSNLKSIHLENISEPTAIIRQICRCVPNLKHLAIRNCPTIPEAALRNLIQCCRKLERLDLSGTKFHANRFYEEIAGLTYLKSVNLSKNSCLSVRNLMSIVLNCHKLEELRLSQFRPIKPLEQLSDEDASFMISNLAPALKSLTLDASTLTNFSFKAIMHCNKLERLGLYGAGNLSPDVFTNIWKCLPKLRVLKVRHAHQITGQNIAELFMSGKHIMQQIVLIDFTGCWKITDTGIEAIGNCCENLESLTLKSCKSVHSLHSISDQCKKIKELNIAFCTNLDPQSVLPLIQNINTLILDKNDGFKDVMQNAKLVKPELRIKICLSEYNKQMENYA